MPSVLSGSINASPSKSQTMRAILFASMADGKSIIRNVLASPDVDAMIEACKKLGAEIISLESVLEIRGVSGKPKIPDDIINAGNSGQVLRFVGAIAALTSGYTVITGDHSVRYNRPVKPLMEGLVHLGAECFSTKNDDHAPIIIKGPISAGATYLDGSDSQPVSALLIAAVFLSGTTEINVKNPGEKPWVNLTLSWLDRFAIEYTNYNFERLSVNGNPKISGFEYTVPGDFSSVAYPLVAALITNSEITINNVDMHDAQGDKKIIDALRKMGAEIDIEENKIIVKSSKRLRGCELEVNDIIDAVTILAVVGCYAEGTTKLTNASIARKKESDRLSTIASELKKMGGDITETNDGLIVKGSKLVGASCVSHWDHRIAMSCAVAALGADGETIISDVNCVNKSYPEFLGHMNALGCDIRDFS